MRPAAVPKGYGPSAVNMTTLEDLPPVRDRSFRVGGYEPGPHPLREESDLDFAIGQLGHAYDCWEGKQPPGTIEDYDLRRLIGAVEDVVTARRDAA